MSLDLSDKVAVVTGASHNIGRATSLELARNGASVACCYATSRDSAHEVVSLIKENGGTAAAYHLDVASPTSVQDTVSQIANQQGPVSILINNAATRPVGGLQTTTTAQFDHVVAVNLRGPFLMAQSVVKGMRILGWGRIINFSGLSAYIGASHRALTVSSKLGVVGLTRALAVELAQWNITVNAVVPGSIATKRADPHSDERIRALLGRIPAGRQGTPSEVAAAVLFLCSAEASFISGQELMVTGGQPLLRQPLDEE